MHGEVGNLVRECSAELHPEVDTSFHKLEEPVCFFLFSGGADDNESFRGVTEGEGVDKATALEEGGLTMDAVCIIFIALSDTNDAALGGMTKGEGGFVHFLPCRGYCSHLFFML